ncbi:hypothetical protein LINPERPRIM_LOCUS37361 [Linum perenne]
MGWRVWNHVLSKASMENRAFLAKMKRPHKLC